ncbi:hypothetical protein, partial [Salmonella enterica]|uniref:hypothetical protein n=1 Tax=Salmonella enterica TaxID=28901 RepID=UPI001C99EBB3
MLWFHSSKSPYGTFPEAMLRICPGYRSMQSGSPDRRNAPPPGKEQIYIASTYLSITPAAIAEPITPA